MANSPTVRVTFDKENNQYVLMDPTDGDDRMLDAIQSNNDNFPFPEGLTISNSHGSHRLESAGDDEDYFLMKKCPCTGDDVSFYCASDKDVCITPRQDSIAGKCFKSKATTEIIQNLALFFWFYCLMVGLHFVTSRQGKHARDYIRGKLCCLTRNERLVDEIVQNPERANFLLWRIQRYHSRRWIRNEEGAGEFRNEEQPDQLFDLPVAWQVNELDEQRDQNPTALALKTRRYVRPSSAATKKNESQCVKNDTVEEEGGEDLTCTICFADIETDERIGALPCEHIFHADCLKTWLKRRNVCPLCQAPDIAAPRYNRDSVGDINNT